MRTTPARLMPSSVSWLMSSRRSISATRVQARVAARALGIHQALGLVDAQSLRVHAGQLSRHADHVQRFVPIVIGHANLTPFRFARLHHKPADAGGHTGALVRRLVTVDLLAIVARGRPRDSWIIASRSSSDRSWDAAPDLDEQRSRATAVLNVGRAHILESGTSCPSAYPRAPSGEPSRHRAWARPPCSRAPPRRRRSAAPWSHRRPCA